MLLTVEKLTEQFFYGELKNGLLTYNDKKLSIQSEKLKDLRKDLSYPVIYKGNNKIEIIEFIELRGKSDYSIKDSVAKVKEIISKSEVGAGLNDHGVAFGLYDFNQGMISKGKKAINGAEIYIEETKDQYYHLVIIAKNKDGYKTLSRILTQSASNQNNQEEKTDLTRPFLKLEELISYPSENLIVLSAYEDGRLDLGTSESDDKLTKIINWIGFDDFYLEVQDQSEISEQLNYRIESLARQKNLKLVATNDYHYLNPEDREAMEVIQAIGLKKEKDKSWFLTGENRFFHTSEDGKRLNLPLEALHNTIEIFNKVESYNLEVKENFNPRFEIPKEFKSEKEYFVTLTQKGLERRLPDGIPSQYQERLDYELSIIDQMGFNGYFLIVADFINYGKRNYSFYDDETVSRWKRFLSKSGYSPNPINFGPARGSCAGSLVAYALAITEIDPMKYGLLFERFLNPERVSMPDIDTDIPDKHRKEVIDYVKDFYNVDEEITESRVAGIAVFGTYKLKALLRALPSAFADKRSAIKLSEQLLDLVVGEPTLTEYLEQPEVQSLRESSLVVDKVLSIAPKLLDLVSNLSQHAAGYVIAPEAVTDFLPTYFVKGEQLTAYTHVEDNGLLKMDFLGLTACSVIQTALDSIREQTGKELTVSSILETATTDLNVFKTLASGGTKNLFQLGSDGMSNVITRCLADVFEDGAEEKAKTGDLFSRIIAGISIYRPGPMAFIDEFIDNALHPDKIKYVVPEMADLLRTSYGLLIYQESIMSLLQTVGGFTLGGADLARRAIGKKKFEELKALKKTFIFGDGDQIPGGIAKTGRTEEELEELWNDVEAFASYGFNKSHAAGYSLIAITEAWLFTYYPDFFAASDLNYVGGNQKIKERDNLAQMIAFYKKQNVKIMGVDVNVSGDSFIPNNGSVYFGLNKVSMVASAAPSIAHERKQNGQFTSLYNFLSRMQRNLDDVNTDGINKSQIRSLILSGGLDSFGYTRKSLLMKLEDLSGLAKSLKANESIIFDKISGKAFDAWISDDGEEMDFQELLSEEKRVTTFYTSGHPTDPFKDESKSVDGFIKIEDFNKAEDNEFYLLGVISNFRKITTKKGDPMAFVTLEDDSDTTELVMFPETFRSYGRYLEKGLVVNIMVDLSFNNNRKTAKITSIKRADELSLKMEVDHLQVLLPNNKEKAFQTLNKIMELSFDPINKGAERVQLSYIFNGTEFFGTKTRSDLMIPFSLTFLNGLKDLVSKESVNLVWRGRMNRKDSNLDLDKIVENGDFNLVF
jgi:DNA polymerase-3 subunit alpha